MTEPTLPHDAQAESDVLAAILSPTGSSWGVVAAVSEILAHPAMFFVAGHRRIYEAVLACYERQGLTDAATVAEELDRQGYLETVGGREKLAALALAAGGEIVQDRLLERARVVRLCAVLRDCIAAGQQVAALGWQDPRAGTAPEQVIFAAEELVRQLSVAHIPDTAGPLERILEAVVAEVTGRVRPPGLGTGYAGVDRLVSLQRGDLVVVGGRPAVGKTSFVAGMAHFLAVRQKEPVLLFTGETTTAQLTKRLLAVASGIPLTTLMAGSVRDELTWLEQARGTLTGAPLIVDGAPRVTLPGLAGQARRLVTLQGVRLVIVDGFQRIRGDRTENSRGLKDLAMQLMVPVVVTSQISRLVEHRADSAPLLADLGEEVPELEQDADTVILLHRALREGRGYEAEACVVKNRNGPPGVAPLRFEEQAARFVDAER